MPYPQAASGRAHRPGEGESGEQLCDFLLVVRRKTAGISIAFIRLRVPGWRPMGTAASLTNTQQEKDRHTMKRLFATLMSVAVLAAFTPVSEAQTSCPAEVSKAKEMLAKRVAMAKGQDAQAPRSLAGARMPDSAQAPRTSSAQAPRGQDAQAPRGQDAQAP